MLEEHTTCIWSVKRGHTHTHWGSEGWYGCYRGSSGKLQPDTWLLGMHMQFVQGSLCPDARYCMTFPSVQGRRRGRLHTFLKRLLIGVLQRPASQRLKASAVKYWWDSRFGPKGHSRFATFYSMHCTVRGLPAPLPWAQPQNSALVSLRVDARLSHCASSPPSSFLLHFSTRITKPATSWTQTSFAWSVFPGKMLNGRLKI